MKISEIKRDMEIGTCGPWEEMRWEGEEWPSDRWSVFTTEGGFAVCISPRYVDQNDLTNARRIARVPDYEAAILAAEALAEALSATEAFIRREYACGEAQALQGELLAKEARPAHKAICEALAAYRQHVTPE